MESRPNTRRFSSISLDETVLTLPEAAAAIPTQNGKRPSVSTIWRWCRKGLRGTRLEYLRCGRRILTSREALDRFFVALAELDQDDTPEKPENANTSESGHPASIQVDRRPSRITTAHEALEKEGL